MRVFYWIVFGVVLFCVQAGRAADYVAARNEWYRCVVLAEYQMDNSSRCDAEAAEESLMEAEWELEMRDFPMPLAPRRPRFKTNKKKLKQTKFIIPDPKKMSRYARHFEAEARQAKARGQLDAALRLFRAAQRIEPGSVEVVREIKGLEEDVN